MTIHDVTAYLARFDAPPPPDGATENRQETSFAPEDDSAETRRLIEELRAKLDAEFEERLRREREEAEGRLARTRDLWTSEQAETLTQRMIQAIDLAFAALRCDLAAILAPFVSQEIARKAIDELINAARTAIADENAPAITLAGPRDLLDKIGRALSSENLALATIETEGVDVRVTISGTTIETRLHDWIACLSDDGSAL